MKHKLSSLVPMSLKTAVHDRLNHMKLERLVRTKERFRAARHQRPRRSTKILRGVNLVAYIRADMGLGAAARGMAAAFEAAGIPFNVINLEHGNYSSHTDFSWSHKEVNHSYYDITVVCVNPDNSFYLRTQVSPKILGERYVVGNWYWELPEIPDDWMSEFEYTDEVWAASKFIHEAILVKATVPVVRVPTVVQLDHTNKLSRRQLGLPERRFLFLAMFDTKSFLQRKNPHGVLRAFRNAFARDDGRVGLVLKFNNHDHEHPILRELQEETAGWKNVLLLDRLLTRVELTSLIAACDCFISLHRAEGFGLGPAEAMSLGKPAIITNWSGNTDYMTKHNCIAIDYELVKLGQDYGPYKGQQCWAEPDVEQAAHWMSKIVRDPHLAAQIGHHAKEMIDLHFSPTAIGKTIHHRLHQIRKNL